MRELGNSKDSSNVPIKDSNGNVLLREEDQEDRWIEHFQSVLNQPSPSTTFDLDGLVDETNPLDVSVREITTVEVKNAVLSLKNNEAPGIDELSAELMKHGGSSVILWLTQFLNEVWRNGAVPQDWKKDIIPKKIREFK